MAFNLEFKITYDELSPSLQDMFKSLQGQITDNRNEITNINMDITDISNEITEINNEINTINNHLTQIDNSITNINENIQNIENDITSIEGDITDLGDQITEINNNITIINDKLEEVDPDTISNLDFLNLAPKIGYYQDDTVEVISKYNMNYDVHGSPAITRNNIDEEVLYTAGNDGSPANNPIQIYMGKRNNDTEDFLFSNTVVDIPYLQGKLTETPYIINVDVNWIVILSRSINNTIPLKGYIVFTNGNSDFIQWTDGIDITNILKDTVNSSLNRPNANNLGVLLTILYFPQYKTIGILFVKNYKSNVEKNYAIRIYDSNTLALKLEVQLDGPFKYMTIPSNRKDISYTKSKFVSSLLDPDSDTVFNLSAWTSIGAPLWFYNQEFLSLELISLRLYYFEDRDKDGIYEYSAYWGGPSVRLAYKIPKSVCQGTSSAGVYCYNQDDNYLELSNEHMNSNFPTFNTIGAKVNYTKSTYDSSRGYIYLLSSEDGLKRKHYYRIKISDCFQTGVANNFKSGVPSLDKVYIPPNQQRSANTADSSQWGKFIKKHFCYNDLHVFYGLSKLGDDAFYVTEWQKIRGFESKNYIEPKPGCYGKIKIERYIEANHNTVKLSDGSAGLYYCSLTSTGVDVSTVEIDKSSSTYQAKYTYLKSFKVQLNDVYRALGFNTANIGSYNHYKQYNPLGDYLLVFIQNLDTTKVDIMSRKLGIALINNNGAITPLLYKDNISNFKNNPIYNINEKGYNSLPTHIQNNGIGVGCFTSKTIYYNNFSWQQTSDSYGDGNAKIVLDNSLTKITSITNTTGSKNNRAYEWKVGLYASIYGGKKYGLTYQMSGWSNNPGWPLYFQKSLFSNEGKEYTEDEWFNKITDNSNVYYIFCQSSQGLICYIPPINIFLGGYYTSIPDSVPVTLSANSANYIYLERGEDRDTINAYSTTSNLYYEGERLFSKICVAKIVTDVEKITDVTYYRINIGYNDYVWNGGGGQ